jgi:hypothetical protein
MITFIATNKCIAVFNFEPGNLIAKPKIAINFSFPRLTLIGSDLFWQFDIKSALPILDND